MQLCGKGYNFLQIIMSSFLEMVIDRYGFHFFFFFPQDLQFILVISYFLFLCHFASSYWPKEIQYLWALTKLRSKNLV